MVGTVQEFIERERAAKDESASDPLIPMWLRLEVPFHSVDKLRQWRHMMAGFLETVDFYLQPRTPGEPYITERAKLIHLRSELHHINANMREYKGRGRPQRLRRTSHNG